MDMFESEVKGLTSTQLGALSAATQINGLTSTEISELTTAQLKGLTSTRDSGARSDDAA